MILLVLIGLLLTPAAAVPQAMGGPPPSPVSAPPVNSASPQACQTLRLHGRIQPARRCFETLAASPDPYLAAEGQWGLGLFQDANESFRRALARQPGSVRVRVRWGRLLHERFNDTDAVGLFQEALQRDPKNARAYLGLALVSADGFDGKALDYARRALALDSSLAPAHVLVATLALEQNDSATASAEADAALKAQPDDLDAMAVHAAIDVLAGRDPAAWLERVTTINPGYGPADALVADQLVLHRRYDDAVTYYRRAIALDPQLWSAHSQLGITLMRLGGADEPRAQLELAYNHGYRDAATVNSLRLLDSYKNFDWIHDGNILLKLDKKESAVLAPYFEALIQRALKSYGAQYGITLPERTSPHGSFAVQVEAYPNHADFAVRSVGLPGLGALGVTFDNVIAMDSPSGRPPGDFNWGTTLWHELDHVFVLTMTKNLVPRWFAEGLAVHEETQADPEWGDPVTPDELAALRDHKLLPVSRLDAGFVNPTYPNQVIVSYFQAGQICDFIQDRWGAAKLVEMVHDFAVPDSTSTVIQRALRLDPLAFDAQFTTWLNHRFGAEANNFDRWRLQLKLLVSASRTPGSDPATVVKLASSVRDLYPDYVYDANPYGYLADAELKLGNSPAAAAALTAYEHHGGHDPDRLKQLARLDVAAHNPAAAAATLDRLNFIYPMDPDLHRTLGDLWLQLNRPQAAIREFTALVDLHPLDRAGAEYDLARAFYVAGQFRAAQNHDISALSAAHDYRPAQQLLVEIMDHLQPQTGIANQEGSHAQ